jgi:hypothetical protein
MSSSLAPDASSDLLSTAYRLTLGLSDTWVGASRSGSPPFGGWQWLDGTPAANIQVTAMGGGVWAGGEPNNGGTGLVSALLLLGFLFQ